MPARPAFDLRAVLCFVAVVEEGSFTRGARRLGLTQQSISEAMRRLEGQLGFALFVRPSRRIQLTAQGEAFLVAARAIARSTGDAQALAQALRLDQRERLRIGALYVSAGIPERAALLHSFMQRHPKVRVEVVHGLKRDLLAQLRASEIDFAIVLRPFDPRGFEWLLLHYGFAHFLVPQEDPLSQRNTLRVTDLGGRSVAAPPREADPEYFASHFERIAAAGATLVPAPEGIDEAMENFARLRRLVHVRFGLGRGARRVLDDMVRLPIEDGESLDLEYALVRRDEPLASAARAFWALAERELKAAKGGARS